MSLKELNDEFAQLEALVKAVRFTQHPERYRRALGSDGRMHWHRADVSEDHPVDATVMRELNVRPGTKADLAAATGLHPDHVEVAMDRLLDHDLVERDGETWRLKPKKPARGKGRAGKAQKPKGTQKHTIRAYVNGQLHGTFSSHDHDAPDVLRSDVDDAMGHMFDQPVHFVADSHEGRKRAQDLIDHHGLNGTTEVRRD